MKKKGLIVFDMDGVIFDSVQLTYQNAKKSIPFLSWKIYQRIFDAPLFFRLINIYKRIFRRNESFELKTRRSEYTKKKLHSPLIDGMDVLIRDLSENYELALNTNAGTQNALPLLDRHDLTRYFAVIKTRDDSVLKAVKNRDILIETDYSPENALFITDSVRDVHDAKEVDMRSIGVLTGMLERHHFEDASIQKSIVAITENSAELKAAIESYFNQK